MKKSIGGKPLQAGLVRILIYPSCMLDMLGKANEAALARHYLREREKRKKV